ncbi:MAG: cellulase family glycosylhydrolase [Ruminococcus sp.]|nr:cellulase family glycosylhydrolase [Ruminococcus sp.]
MAMKRSAMALLTAAAMLLTGVSCAKKDGSSKVSEIEKNTDAQETTVITEEETKEMATEHISPVETVSATLGSQISVNRTIGRAEGSNTIKFPLADLIEEGDRVTSFTFTVYSGDGGNIGEFKGGCGISVDDKCPAATNKGWYQSGDFTAPTQGSYGEITWNVPDELKDYIHEGGEVLFGYWWGNCDSLRIENVVCKYDRTRDVPVDGMGAAKVGKSVGYSDEDNIVHIPLDFIPEGMVPEVVNFNISTAGSLGKFTGAYGISSDEGKFMSGDVSVFTDSSELQLTWFVPDKAKGCMGGNSELQLGYWWSDQPTITVDTIEVKYSVGGGDYPSPTKIEVATMEPTTEPTSGEKGFRTATEIVSQIKVGWNLGNTLESYNTGKSGLDTETGWENPKTTKDMIKSVKQAGFNAIRIPVTWSEHMSGNTIQKEWLDRVQEVVDYAYNEGLFVIINMHHDDYIWFDPQPGSYGDDSARLSNIWKQISERFADYDDKLIFEGMNEPRTVGSAMEWMGGTKEERNTVNKYAKTFVDTVRASGGNNSARTLIVTTYAASADSVALNDMSVPSGKNIVLSVHYYAPWRFAEGTETVFTPSGESELEGKFTELRQKFIDKGIPVLICEFGCVHGADEATRSRYYTYYISAAKKQGIKCFVWDNSKFSGESSFGMFNRNSVAWDGAILKAVMDGAK